MQKKNLIGQSIAPDIFFICFLYIYADLYILPNS